LKPSLWEDQGNMDKTVALWKKLAERYADEYWVGGYDLINETNWDMSGNVLLRDLYYDITEGIRTVDTNHILFIEGNWFANDFGGLTPPWDDKIVYSPHKYWSVNDQASIQWVLDIQDVHNVPIYFGESGENSNVWFRDAIRLFEDHSLGWAWWPMKKIESIAGPLSIHKTAGYQALFDYWNGTGTQPTAAFAKASLMGMTENLKLENCRFQKDVIDAMFRQVYSDEALPYNTQSIPGIVYATDFDMGVVGSAYFDTDLENHQVSTGNYTSWNNGWVYRNDGVDIEVTEDITNTNGYNLGWLAAGEWMQYDVDVAASAIYDIHVRVAANDLNGKIHFSAGNADISGTHLVPGSGGWQNWQTMIIPGIILSPSDKKIRVHIDVAGYNLGSLKFIQQAETNSIPTDFLSAITLNASTVQLNLNKPLEGPIPASPAGFHLFANGKSLPVSSAVLDTSNSRSIIFTLIHTFTSSEAIKISYTGDQIIAKDGTILQTFSNKDVQNTIAIIHDVPGKVEAEEFYLQSGIELENTTDEGGGQNIGYLDAGDYLDYYINVAQSGIYTVQYRTASQSESGQVQMQLINAIGGATVLHAVSFPSTGGWQTWQTTSQTVSLFAGLHHLRIVITKPLFNVNWFEFTFLSSVDIPDQMPDIRLFPNPGTDIFYLQGKLDDRENAEIQVFNSSGQQVFNKVLEGAVILNEMLDLAAYPAGIYYVTIRTLNSIVFSQKIIKITN